MRDKRNDPLGLLSLLGVTLNDWKKGFSEQNKSDAKAVAASDLKVLITKVGDTATVRHDDVAANGFYTGKTDVYRVTLEADSSADKGKNVPFGSHASLTMTAVVGNPREAARKALWGKFKQVQDAIKSKLNLSAGERDALENEARSKAEEADEAVKGADFTNIEKEKTKGVKNLEDVAIKAQSADTEAAAKIADLDKAKEQAAKQVKDAQEKARGVVTGLEDLGESERATRLKEIDEKATSALEAINRATTSAEAYKHAAEGTKGIDDLLLFILKTWGKAVVLVYGGENGQPRKSLNALLKPEGGLTQPQIDEYIERIQMVVDGATRNGGSIDLATSVHDVFEAVKQAKSGIDGIVAEAQQASRDALKALEQAKAKAEAELQQIADAAKDKVSKIAGAGQSEMDAANAKIDEALKTALTAVAQADTVEGVRKAVNDGRDAIEKILTDLENMAKKHRKPAPDKPAKDKPAADKGKPTADKPAALAATGVAVGDMALLVALLAMLAAVGAAMTRRRR
ncbi:DUF1542 domain-containing protein [Bifidobacterium panos]|uniref:DUF1542 domain-containing protein n=1 Tax=Bifidobacterium panos TaxID=2675321 RepID=UPI00155790C5